MFHNSSKFALLAVFGVAAAEEAVVSLFIPLFAPNFVVASVVDVGADETTFALACHSQVPQTECGISNPVQLVAGPSTMALTATLEYTSASPSEVLPMSLRLWQTSLSTTNAAGEAATTTEAGNAALPRMTQNAVLARYRCRCRWCHGAVRCVVLRLASRAILPAGLLGFISVPVGTCSIMITRKTAMVLIAFTTLFFVGLTGWTYWRITMSPRAMERGYQQQRTDRPDEMPGV
ncbi:predicted protein [Verticillium alfalfae VaMs.102]|uniref:Predicted protein n=1 Tax=Verticillium alfalfae (strain VaMs.102 / ATCC MYA-4576 / FGSC 10136) TaxID=526221 RepID=C9S829_VERA1|nr:predicted protein [Verticillium alfalfae VaMs.102]EEY14875.1 predicted protein [Verticillium alfalfae VaMs.102]